MTGRYATLPAAIILGLAGIGTLVYVVLGYATAIGTANAQANLSPVGLLFAAAAASVLVTAWGLWQHRAWARFPGRVVGVLAVIVGLALLAYLALLGALASEIASAALPMLGGSGVACILAGGLVWWSAGGVRPQA